MREFNVMQVGTSFFVLLVTSFSLSAAAQTRELDLKTSVNLGIANSPELKQAESKRNETRSKSWEYKSEIFPEITANASTVRKMNSDAIRSSSSVSPSHISDTYTAWLELKQPIVTGWALVSGWKLSSSLKTTAEKEFYSSQQEVVKNLIMAFYDFAAANDTYRAAQTNYETLQNYMLSMARYAKIGRGREMDRLQASVNASISQLDAESALQTQQDAELHLKTLLNIPPLQKVSTKFNFAVQSVDPITVDQAVDLALKNNPKLALLEAAIKQTDLKNDIEISADLPSLNFVASYGTQSLDRDELFQSNSDFYSYGFNLTIPLFSGFSSMSRRREFREQVFQTEKTFEIEKRTLRERIKTALSNVNRLYKQYENMQTVTKNAQRALDLVNSGFRQGTTTPQDVVNFQANRYKAEQKLIEVQYSYLKSVVELRELLGIDLLRVYGGTEGKS